MYQVFNSASGSVIVESRNITYCLSLLDALPCAALRKL